MTECKDCKRVHERVFAVLPFNVVEKIVDKPLLRICGVAYGLIGYASQDKPFEPKRFLRTVAIQTLATLGLAVTGISRDIYTNAVGPTAVTVFVQKIWDGLTKKLAKF